MLRLLMALAIGFFSSFGCGGDDTGHHPPPPGDGDADADTDADADADGDADPECFADYDGDGYGPNCPAGEDCNDNDPERHDDCSSCRPGIPQLGCDCFGTEDPFDCHSQELYDDGHGRLRCRVGKQYCSEDVGGTSETGFAWGECLDDQGNPVDG